MWPAQKQLLKKFGGNVIALDGTHGLIEYDFILQTMLVLDYDGEGLPVAFALSNRNDKAVIDIFLCLIKMQVGILAPRTLMTDMQPTYYYSWVTFMVEPMFRLFCTWHVREAWRKNKSKIKNKDKRAAVMADLYNLADDLDVDKFWEKLRKFLNQEDPDVQEFLDYFEKQYVSEDSVDYWAYCYRATAGLNTSTHLEALHKILKYIHGCGKIIKTLYAGLKIIHKCLAAKVNSVSVKVIRGKIATKLKSLRVAHKVMEEYIANHNDLSILKKSENDWIVPSFEQRPTKYYIVTQVAEVCPVDEDEDYDGCNLFCDECGTCAHMYRCTCTENAIKNNMCKHIHVVLYTRQRPENEISRHTVPSSTAQLSHLKPPSISDELVVRRCVNKEEGNKDTCINKMKEKLTEKFLDALREATTVEQLRVVENVIRPLEPYIRSTSTSRLNYSFIRTSHDGAQRKRSSSKIPKQKRFFESTKKKKYKKQRKQLRNVEQE